MSVSFTTFPDRPLQSLSYCAFDWEFVIKVNDFVFTFNDHERSS